MADMVPWLAGLDFTLGVIMNYVHTQIGGQGEGERAAAVTLRGPMGLINSGIAAIERHAAPRRILL